jgi:DNA invertase Pin-like site-specific DNA recombinase
MIKVSLYARVSLDETPPKENEEKRRYQDPENQLQPLREFCKTMGWEVIEEYTDRMSGANPARPAFRKMMQDALMRRFSGILVWKLDRFSREGIMPTMSYIKQLKDRGIWLKSMTEGWLDTSQEGITDIVLAIMSWASAEERKRISERTKAGIARKKGLGNWRGGRPRKVTPQILDVCEKKEDGFYCKLCQKRFNDETTFMKKWSAHTYSSQHKGLQLQKGGQQSNAPT